MRVGHVGREGQVLDGRPTSDHAELRDVVVRVAIGDTTGSTKSSADRTANAASAAEQGLGRVVVHDRSISTVDGSVPVRIPVVGVSAAEAPGLDRLLLSASREHRVRRDSEANALLGSGQIGAAIYLRATSTNSQVLDVVTGRTVRIHALDVDGAAGAGRDVSDRQGQLTGPAPLVVRMAGQLGGTVVGRVVVMRRDRRLEQTPSLVNTQ